jgi:hypothetical protein
MDKGEEVADQARRASEENYLIAIEALRQFNLKFLERGGGSLPGIANYRAHVPLFAFTFCIRKIGCYQVLCKYAQAFTCAYFCAAALTDAIPRRRQLPASQRSQLSAQPEAAVASGGWEVVHEYHDAGISGARSREARPGLDEMLKIPLRPIPPPEVL